MTWIQLRHRQSSGRGATLVRTLPLLFNLVLVSSPAEGRFYHADANRLDAESEFSIEHYNDVDSYALPLEWERNWQESAAGVRASAGSLNQTRFLFSREIKFSGLFDAALAQESGSAYLTFSHSAWQDKLEDVTANILGIGYLGPSANASGGRWDLRLRADGDSRKKWADLGALAGWRSQPFDFYLGFWSVDHYFNTKEDESNLAYTEKPLTWDGSFRIRPTSRWEMVAAWEIDVPTELAEKETAVGRNGQPRYRYRRWLGRMAASFQEAGNGWSAWYSEDRKTESLYWDAVVPADDGDAETGTVNDLNANGLGAELQRLYREMGVEWRRSYGTHGLWQAGVSMRARQALYSYLDRSRGDGVTEAEDATGFSDTFQAVSGQAPEDDSRLLEPAFNLRWFPDNSGSDEGFYFGWHSHFPDQRRDAPRRSWSATASADSDGFPSARRRRHAEIKSLVAWQKTWDKRGRLAFGSTWDLDQLYHDFPYNRRSFQPWGGGSIQFQLAF